MGGATGAATWASVLPGRCLRALIAVLPRALARAGGPPEIWERAVDGEDRGGPGRAGKSKNSRPEVLVFVSVVTSRFDPARGEFDPAPLESFTRDKVVLGVREFFFSHGDLPHLAFVVTHRLIPPSRPDGGQRSPSRASAGASPPPERRRPARWPRAECAPALRAAPRLAERDLSRPGDPRLQRPHQPPGSDRGRAGPADHGKGWSESTASARRSPPAKPRRSSRSWRPRLKAANRGRDRVEPQAVGPLDPRRFLPPSKTAPVKLAPSKTPPPKTPPLRSARSCPSSPARTSSREAPTRARRRGVPSELPVLSDCYRLLLWGFERAEGFPKVLRPSLTSGWLDGGGALHETAREGAVGAPESPAGVQRSRAKPLRRGSWHPTRPATARDLQRGRGWGAKSPAGVQRSRAKPLRRGSWHPTRPATARDHQRGRGWSPRSTGRGPACGCASSSVPLQR